MGFRWITRMLMIFSDLLPEPIDSIPKPPADNNVDALPEAANRPKAETSFTYNFTWNISNFSQLTSQKLYSDTFIAGGGCIWRLLLFPKGNRNVDHLSIYLGVADSEELPDGWSRDAEFSLSVINQSNDDTTVTQESQRVFTAEEKNWGFASLIPLNKIKDPAEGYLVKDTLTVEVEVLVLSVVHADVQSVCKGLIAELSSRKRPVQSVSGNEIFDLNQTFTPDIQQQQKEALQGFFNMSLEAVKQSNCFPNIEEILGTLVQHTDNLQEKTFLEEIISRLEEFKESIPRAKAVVETSQAQRESLAGKTAHLDTKLEQRQKELRSLESEISMLSEEEAKIEAEMQQLMAKKEEVVTRKKSVSLKLERANEETCKDIDEWRSLEREIKKANGEWLAGKEELASANVRWKLFRETLGLGNLNIS